MEGALGNSKAGNVLLGKYLPVGLSLHQALRIRGGEEDEDREHTAGCSKLELSVHHTTHKMPTCTSTPHNPQDAYMYKYT